MSGVVDWLVDTVDEGFNDIIRALIPNYGYKMPSGSYYEDGTPASLKPSEMIPYLVDKYKSKPGDFGYFDPSAFFEDPNYAASVIPGMSDVQTSTDMARYWSDYRKNTHKQIRYPGVAYHSPTLGQTAGSVMGMMDWWR